VLREAGKTLDDLREAVERLQARRRLREQMDELPKLAAERQEIEKQLAAADNILADAEQQHSEVTAPLASPTK
jgi:predicted  nucleic acid-binding Zn-ribbon protein